MITLQTKTDAIQMERTLFQNASKTFTILLQRNEMDEINLRDFSWTSVSQFREFVYMTQSLDIKIQPVQSYNLKEYVQNSSVLAFFETKHRLEILELLLLANFLDSTLLRELCCLVFVCWMRIPQHAVMAPLFGFQLHQPDPNWIEQYVKIVSR